MTTEVYIENYRLDISNEISALLNFAIDDIKDFSARSTTWSKTIVLPGTANNNQLFGHIFQIGQANYYMSNSANVGYNFNASKSADCIIFQDHVQSFRGVLRLLQINISGGRIEYEVSVFGKLAGLNASLSGGLLEHLDFSAYDHVYNGAAVSNSWENVSGAGYFYPLIDYGTYSTGKHDWDIRTFRPALYVREYIDKMFSAAGFRWSSDLFDSDRFKKIVVPFNRKEITILSTSLSTATILSPKNFLFLPSSTITIAFDTNTGTGFTPDGPKEVFTYTGGVSTNVTLDFSYIGTHDFFYITLNIVKNGSTSIYSASSGVSTFSFSDTIVFSIAPGDTIEFQITSSGGAPVPRNLDLTTAQFEITTDTGVPVTVSIGDTIVINECIPKNVRQIDFLVGIVKLFNLYVYEDRFDTTLIYLKPFIDYYSTNSAGAIDWTYKLDRDKDLTIKPMSELNAKIYNFKFKADSDYYNELYRKRYGQGYGDYIFDSQFEFAEQQKSFEIIFSSTPLVGYSGEDKVYPTIFKRTGSDASPTEELTDSNIRILQTKKIVGVSSWDMKDGVATVGFFTKYGYAGHLDDPDAPDNDLNFGALRELFFTLVTGNLSNTQFNVYWSSYMAEITDKDSKLLSAKFYLTPKDILELDFSKYIYLDGVLFRLNSIKDYNATRPATCGVELLKVGYTDYTAVSPATEGGDSPPPGNFLLWDNNQTLDYDDALELLYGDDVISSTIDWSFTKTASIGLMRIFVNGGLVLSQSSNGSGSFSVNVDDVVQVNVIKGLIGTAALTVTSDVEGVLYNNSGATQTYSWTVLSPRTYTVQGSVT